MPKQGMQYPLSYAMSWTPSRKRSRIWERRNSVERSVNELTCLFSLVIRRELRTRCVCQTFELTRECNTDEELRHRGRHAVCRLLTLHPSYDGRAGIRCVIFLLLSLAAFFSNWRWLWELYWGGVITSQRSGTVKNTWNVSPPKIALCVKFPQYSECIYPYIYIYIGIGIGIGI